MSATGFTGIVVIVLFTGLMIFFSIIQDPKKRNIRPISGYDKINQEINIAVEDGTQLHISLGRGGLTGPEAASALAGLGILKHVIDKSSFCDYPPVVSTGDAVISMLAQDTIKGSSKAITISERRRNPSGELVGVTPFSYAAGTLSTIRDKNVSANIHTGWFGNEVIWLTTAGERQSSPTVAGTSQLPAQAVIYASAPDSLIGEELFAGGAYLEAGKIHQASISTQDVIRWIIIVIILGSVLLNFLGIDSFLEDILGGVNMNIKLKTPVSTAIAIGVGIVVLAGYFIPSITGIRFILLRIGLVLAAVALLVGIINLLTVHIKKMGGESENSGYSLILVISLIATLIVGIIDMVQTYVAGRPNFLMTNWVFTYIQLPIETTLLAVTAVSLTYAAASILRKRMDLFSLTFFFVVLLVLLGSFSIPPATLPFLQSIRDWILRVPALGGARGLLLGIALGTITTGIRILMGTDRPYGG